MWRKPPATYLFKLLISASLKTFPCPVICIKGKKENKSGLPGSTVAGFVYYLSVDFALQYLIKLGNEVGLYQSPPPPLYFTKAILGKG
jgi:hypothetical protein